MSRVYVPWTQRPAKQIRGLSGLIAAPAIMAYRLFGPIVRRFPGLIFTLALVGTCLGAWVVVLVFQDRAAAAALLAEQQTAVSGQAATGWYTAEEFTRAVEQLGLRAPGRLLWSVQWLLLRDLIAFAGLVGFISLVPIFCIWWERKIAAHIQSRVGPMRTGGWHGWSQSIADGLKLIAKEDLIPATADGALFRLAPYVAFVPSVAAYIVLPFGAYCVFRDLDVGLLFILAMLGIEVMGVILAAWASNNKWSLYGGMREACQVVSYEIPLGMSLLVPVMTVSTLRFSTMAEWQADGWFSWLVFRSPWTFVACGTYFVASLASVKRAPFDLPESESELVAGFHTEYSGFRWSLFFFAEYAAMFAVSGVAVILFLGAWHAPWPAPQWLAEGEQLWHKLVYGVFFSGPLWFVGKSLMLIYVQLWLRWTLPRIRIDQVLYSCIQVMVPLAMVVLLGGTFWELLRTWDMPVFNAVASTVTAILGLIGAAVVATALSISWHGFRNRRALVGSLAVDLLPGA